MSVPAPVLDPTETGTSTTVSIDELTKIPTSRDPFATLRTVPGVLLDRVNIGGNETGQAPTVVSKGTRPQDTVWTLDGIVITDMAAAGAPPTYFNFDNFEEIQVSTAGQDISQQTGGVGINLVTRRGTNQFHGAARGYFANDALEASNVPAELQPTVTPADGGPQQADLGYRGGVRRAHPLESRLVLRVVFIPGYPARPPRGRRDRRHDAEQSGSEGELAGQHERHAELRLFQRLEGQGLSQSGRPGHPVRRTDRHVSPGQRLHRLAVPRPVEDRGRPRHQPEPVSVRDVRLLQHGQRADAHGRHGHAGRPEPDNSPVVRLDQRTASASVRSRRFAAACTRT